MTTINGKDDDSQDGRMCKKKQLTRQQAQNEIKQMLQNASGGTERGDEKPTDGKQKHRL